MSDERTKWTVCGRLVGTATGWDQGDTFVMQIYNFEPAPGWKGPGATECLSFDFERGLVQTWGEGPKETVDLITALQDCVPDQTGWP